MAGTDAIIWPDASGTWNVQAIASAAAFGASLRAALAALPAGGGRLIILPSSFTTANGLANAYEWDATACAVTKQNVLIEAHGAQVCFVDNAHATGLEINRPNVAVVGLTCVENNNGAPANRRHISFRQVSAVRCDDGRVENCRFLYRTTGAFTNGGNAFVGVDGHEAADMCRGFHFINNTCKIGTGAVGPAQVNQWYSGGIYPTHASMLIASHVQGLLMQGNRLMYGGTDVTTFQAYFGAMAVLEECPYSQVLSNTARGIDLRGISTNGSLFICRKYGPSGWSAAGVGGFEGHHDVHAFNQFEDCFVSDIFLYENAHYTRNVMNMYGRGTASGAMVRTVNGTAYSVPSGADGFLLMGNGFHNNLGLSWDFGDIGGLNIGPNDYELMQDQVAGRIRATATQVRFKSREQSVSWSLKNKPRQLWQIDDPAASAHRDASSPANDAVEL